MSDDFWRRLSIIAGLFTLLGIFCLTVFIANVEIKDLDLWLHLGMGRHIVENGYQVPKVDMLSATIAGTPWINHEWLFQVIVYHVHKLSGPEGLIMMQLVIVCITMLILLFLGYNKDKQLATIFSLLLVSLVYFSRFTIRPDIYSLLFFALYIFILSFFIDRKWSLYALFIIQILWSNIHGFFFFGPLFVLIGLISEALKRHVPLPYEWNKVGRLTDDEYLRLKWVFGAVLLACLFNPCTFKGAWYPLRVFFQISGDSSIFFKKIIELQKPITWATLGDTGRYSYYKILIVISFLSFVYNRWKLDIGVLIFWVVFLVFSLSAVRNLIFFAFAAYLVFVTNALSITMRDIAPLRITDKKFIYIASIILKICLITWIIQYGTAVSVNGYYDFDKYERKSEFGGVSLRQYPYKAVDFLVENGIRGNFFNDFNSGAYLVGRCHPDIKVFIDGRTEVYGPEFFKYYQKIWEKGSKDDFAKMLEKYDMTGALLNSALSPIPPNPLKYLEESEEWIPVYFNFDGFIYLKNIPENKEMIEKYRIDLKNWDPIKLDLYRLGSSRVEPYQHNHRAFSLETLGYHDAALRELDEAVKISPFYGPAYKLKGKIYAEKKDYQKTFENYRLAVMYKPKDRQVRISLARSYQDLGEYKHAVKQYRKIIDRWPNSPQAYFLLAETYAQDKSYDKAVKVLKKACSLNPKSAGDILKIGDLLFDGEQYNRAGEAYSLGREGDPKSGKVYFKLGRVYQKLGNQNEALEAFKKAQELDPDNEEIKSQLKELGIEGNKEDPNE